MVTLLAGRVVPLKATTLVNAVTECMPRKVASYARENYATSVVKEEKMKLLFCESCHDIFRLTLDSSRCCSCGGAWGWYEKDCVHATYGGDYAVPLGFANSSFRNALDNRPIEGVGKRFEAFVVPMKCDTFVKKEDKNAPQV